MDREIPKEVRDKERKKMLIKYGVYTRTCSDKIGLNGEFIRIASRTKKENKIILKAIKEIFA